MKNDIFISMKEQMIPESSIIASLEYRLKTEKKSSFAGYVVRWSVATAAATVAILLAFNMTMPSAAEQIPVVGRAFESLNDYGKQSRAEGKTPAVFLSEVEEEGFGISISCGESNGLDLSFTIELEDREGAVTDKTEVITLGNACVEVGGMYLYPTDESPRLFRSEDGIFRGEAVFNVSPAAILLSDGEATARLYAEDIIAYVEGATFEEVVSLYTYELSLVEELPFTVDMSELQIDYVGIERDGVKIEQILSCDARTDVVYSVGQEVDYAHSLSLLADNRAPSVTRMAATDTEDGRYVYIATFDGGESLKADGETMDIYVDTPFNIYSYATGEYLSFEDRYESQVEVEG